LSDSAWQQEINWADLYRRLCVLADRLLSRAPVEALEAEDLAQETIRKLLAVPERFLKPDTRDLIRVLCQALKFEYQDRLRQQQLRRELLRASGAIEPATTGNACREAQIEYQQIRGQLGEPALEELVDAMMEATGEPNQNQKLATLLQSTPGEVVNRKKRLRRRVEMILRARKPAWGEE
jgi:DNA-directed RNA polymerase specialized sigma24 family protein